MTSSKLTRQDVAGTDLSPEHNKKAFDLLNDLAGMLDNVTAPSRTMFGAQGMGLAATVGDATSRTHTGTLTADELIFDVTTLVGGRKVTSVDVLATISCSGTAATGSLTTVAKANTANDDYFTLPKALLIDDVLTSVIFFYDVDGGSVTTEDDTHVKIDIAADTTAAEVAARTRTAINSVTDILWNFAAPVSATITGTYADVGTVGNATWTENVVDAGFQVVSSTGGIDATLADFTVTLETYSNGSRTTLADTTGEDGYNEPGSDKTVTFTADDYTPVDGSTVLVAIDLDLRKTDDSVIIKSITVNCE